MEKEKEIENLRESMQRCLLYLKQKNDALTQARKSITTLDLIINDLKVCIPKAS